MEGKAKRRFPALRHIEKSSDLKTAAGRKNNRKKTKKRGKKAHDSQWTWSRVKRANVF